MLEVASLIIINLIVAAIIGFIIGYLVGRNSTKVAVVSDKNKKTDKKENTDTKAKTGVNPIFKKSSSLDNKPLVISSPRPSGKDNLKKIKGINTKIENDLNSLGIYHFDQISSWSGKNCDWIESFLLDPGCAKNNQWVEQAKILKSGKETIYSQKVESGEIEVD